MADTEDFDPVGLTDELAKKYDPERMLRSIAKRAGKSESLDHSVRSRYEQRFGVDLGHVRVITGEFAEEFNKKRGAYAVTVGTTGMILMGGSPDKSMASAGGQALLAHELTHVAQAKGGLHRKATAGHGMPYTEEHEAEAEAVEHSVEHEHRGHDAHAHHDAKMKADEAHKQALEKIKERVFELAAEVARADLIRNGVQRRP